MLEILLCLFQNCVEQTNIESISIEYPFITGNSEDKELEDLELLASSITLYDNCNENPKQYDKYFHKFKPYKCETCLIEIWKLSGVSMTPTFKSGNLLKMYMNGFSNLTEGMIVIYDTRSDVKGSQLNMTNAKKYNYNIIHQIVAIQDDNYVIKGQNNLLCELIPKNAIKAVLKEIDY